MILVCVSYPHGSVNMTIEEAETLLHDLSTNIDIAKMHAYGTLTFIDEQYISRRTLYDFFGASMSQHAVRNRAGKLFSALVRSAMPRRSTAPLPLRVLCGECKLPLDESKECKVMRRSCGHVYYTNEREYYIDINSLMEYKDQFLSGGTYELAGKKLQDFTVVIQMIERG